MTVRDDVFEGDTRDHWRYGAMRHEVIEMHLFDNNAPEEKALCGEGTLAHDRMGVDYYLEVRNSGLGVGTVCEQCKVLVMPFAVNVSRNLEGDGEVAGREACCP